MIACQCAAGGELDFVFLGGDSICAVIGGIRHWHCSADRGGVRERGREGCGF